MSEILIGRCGRTQEGQIRINKKSDFPLTLKLVKDGNFIKWYDCDFDIKAFVEDGFTTYTAGRSEGVFNHCRVEEDGTLTLFFDNHNLSTGELQIEVVFHHPDNDYGTDGVRQEAFTVASNILLVNDNGNAISLSIPEPKVVEKVVEKEVEKVVEVEVSRKENVNVFNVLGFDGFIENASNLEAETATANYTILFDKQNKRFVALHEGSYSANWHIENLDRTDEIYQTQGENVQPYANKIYIDKTDSVMYYWDGSNLSPLKVKPQDNVTDVSNLSTEIARIKVRLVALENRREDSANTNTGAVSEHLDINSEEFARLKAELKGENKTIVANIANKILKGDGSLEDFNNFVASDFIEVKDGDTITFSGLWKNEYVYRGVFLYNENKTPLATQINNNKVVESLDVQGFSGLKYIRISGKKTDKPSVKIVRGSDIIKDVRSMGEKISKLENSSIAELKNAGEFGSKITEGDRRVLRNGFNCATPVNGVYKGKEQAFLENIEIECTSGVATFGIGVLDQSRKAVITKTFSVKMPNDGYNNVSVLAEKITINPGQQLFFLNGENNVKIYYGETADKSNSFQEGYYGTFENMHPFDVANKILLFTLKYSAVQIDSLFASKAKIEELEKELETLQNSQYVFDNKNKPYKLKVVDGEIKAISANYKEVVVLGNSLTWHAYWGENNGEGWCGENRSMASTTDEVSWCNLLKRILQKREPTANVKGVMVRDWERASDGQRDINNASLSTCKRLIDGTLTASTDLIIFRAGENGQVKNPETYKNEVLALIDYCQTISPLAEIVICGCFWPNQIKDNAIYNAALERGYSYISAGIEYSKYTEMRGDFHVDSKTKKEVLLSNIVLSHTADKGFYLWANHVAKKIGYGKEQLDELHKISVNSTLSKGFKIKEEESPANALVTILTYESATIEVRGKSGQAVAFKSHDLTNKVENFVTAFTFLMPNEDVVVTLRK